jgi:Flp pilus assembly protein TadG
VTRPSTVHRGAVHRGGVHRGGVHRGGVHRGAARRWAARHGLGERGASAVELAVLAPAMLFATMLIIQFALWFNARHAALAAAQAGARIAREEAAVPNRQWQADARQEAISYYDALGTRLLTGVTVQPSGDMAAGRVFVTVSGQLDGILPFHMTITQMAGGPVECFRPAGRGGACG